MENTSSGQDIDARTLARKLSSRHPAIRASAQRLLEGFHGELRSLVIRQLINDVKKTRRTGVMLQYLTFVLGVCLGIMTVSNFFGFGPTRYILFLPVYVTGIAWSYVWTGPLQRQCSALMQALAGSGDPKLIGTLIDAIPTTPTRSRRLLREALEQSVAQIRPEDTDLVTRDQVAYLAFKVAERWGDAIRGVSRYTPERESIYASRWRW